MDRSMHIINSIQYNEMLQITVFHDVIQYMTTFEYSGSYYAVFGVNLDIMEFNVV